MNEQTQVCLEILCFRRISLSQSVVGVAPASIKHHHSVAGGFSQINQFLSKDPRSQDKVPELNIDFDLQEWRGPLFSSLIHLYI